MLTPSEYGSVECIILGAGYGTRLGRGPKAFVRLGKTTLLEMAVQSALQIKPSRVIVALPEYRIECAKKLILDPRVSFVEGGRRRIDTLRTLVEKSTAQWIVLHDVVHPFVSLKLFSDVLDAARVAGGAAAVDQIYDFIYGDEGEQLAKPGKAHIIQKPIAFCRDKIQKGFKLYDSLGISDDPSILEIFDLAGIIPAFIQGLPWNRKITHLSDLKFAETISFKFIGNNTLIDES
jgi:2-C-methyl-D-erythritol 4-phosphate cytidylyltransferase